MRRRLSGLWMATNRPREHRDFRASFFSFRVSHGGHGATEDFLAQIPKLRSLFVVVLVLENPDRFAIRLTEQISLQDIGLFAVTESQCTEDEDDDETRTINFGV